MAVFFKIGAYGGERILHHIYTRKYKYLLRFARIYGKILSATEKAVFLQPVFEKPSYGHHPVNNEIMLSVSIIVT